MMLLSWLFKPKHQCERCLAVNRSVHQVLDDNYLYLCSDCIGDIYIELIQSIYPEVEKALVENPGE